MLTVIMNLHDVRMVERSDQLRLGTETCEQFPITGVDGPDHFNGDEAVQRRLPRLVDHAHSAASNEFQDLEARFRPSCIFRHFDWGIAYGGAADSFEFVPLRRRVVVESLQRAVQANLYREHL